MLRSTFLWKRNPAFIWVQVPAFPPLPLTAGRYHTIIGNKSIEFDSHSHSMNITYHGDP